MVGAYNREVSIRKAKRKKCISDRYWHSYYDNLHQYSKNKIHCSCANCSRKTRNKGNRRYKAGNYSCSLCYKASDLRKLISMDEKEKTYFDINLPRRRAHNW